MASAFRRAFSESRAWSNTCREMAAQNAHSKMALAAVMTGSSGGSNGGGGFSSFFGGDDQGDKERYGAYRTWLYSAVHALGMQASKQPVNVGQLTTRTKQGKPARHKGRKPTKLPKSLIAKAAAAEMEIIPGHQLQESLERPNPIQSGGALVYTFLVNMCLTGWGYIVYDEGENGPEFYAVPSSWVTPDHQNGPFSRFKIKNPKAGVAQNSEDEWVDASRVGFAYLPNPADPLAAVPPAGTQSQAIKIDDSIQECQAQFFKNGVFPSVAVAVGREPHPDIPGGIRPRLSKEQRAQIHQVIKEQMAGVWNYGKPAIIDGLIESITRLVPSQQEIGWEKSEQMIRTRILSAYGVHPFVLGETVNVGGYAQAYVIMEQFYDRVNAFLAMLGEVVTRLARSNGLGDNVVAWWEECEARDPSLYQAALQNARANGDITKNEYRAALGFPPDLEDEAGDNRSPLLDTVGGMTGAVAILSAMGNGLITREAAVSMFEQFFQIDRPEAEQMVGDLVEQPEPDPVVIQQPPQLPPPSPPAADQPPAPELDAETMTEAAKRAALKLPPATVADAIVKYLELMQTEHV